MAGSRLGNPGRSAQQTGSGGGARARDLLEGARAGGRNPLPPGGAAHARRDAFAQDRRNGDFGGDRPRWHRYGQDVGIALGQAFARALGAKAGIRRYGCAHLSMDETLSRVAVDISGRPFLVFRAEFRRDTIGGFDTELVREWFQAFAMNAGITLHAETLYGDNAHHMAESLFKGLARALREACAEEPREAGRVPSTKGAL